MDKLEGLRAGVDEMRSVARKLNQWADDLEASFRGTVVSESIPETDVSEVPASEPVPAEKRKRSAKQAVSEPAGGKGPAADAKTGKVLTLPEVRSVLAEKCAEGFGPQVKALIESYGASSLKEVPADKYEELLSSVAGLGDGSGSGGDADAG